MPVDLTVTRLAYAHSSPVGVYLYVNVHIWGWEVSVFAQNCEPRVGGPLFPLLSDGCRARRCVVQPSQGSCPNLREAGRGVRERGGSQPGHQGGAVTCGLGRAHWVAVFGLTQHFRFLPCSWRPLPTKCLFAQHWPPPPRSPAPLQRDGPWRVGEVQHDPTDQLLGTRSVSLSWSCWGSPQWANPASSSALSRVNSTSTRRAQLEVSGPKGEGVASGKWKKCLGVEEKGS